MEYKERVMCVALFFAFLALPPILTLGRVLDVNTLVSWQWTMGEEQPFRIVFLLLPLLAGAYFLSGVKGPASSRLLPAAAAALAALPFLSAPEPVIDAGRYFLQAKNVAQNGPLFFWQEWGTGVFAWTDLPLVPFVHGLWLAAWGERRIVSQLLSVLFFAGLVMLTSLFGAELWRKKTGERAGWLLLASPWLIFLAPALLVDIPAAFFLVGALLFTLRFLKKGGLPAAFPAVFFLSMALLTKYSLWLYLPVLLAAMVAGRPTRDGRPKTCGRALVVFLPALVLPLFFCFTHKESVVAQLRLLTSFQAAALAGWDEGFWSAFLFQLHPLVLLMAAGACVSAIRTREKAFSVCLAAILLVLFLPTNRLRYLAPLLPLVCLAAARGLEIIIAPDRVRRFAVQGAVATSLCVAFVAYVPFACGTAFMNITEAGRLLDKLPTEGGRLLVRNHTALVGPRALVPLVDMATAKTLCLEPDEGKVTGPASVCTSPLRFSWEMDLGGLYRRCGPNDTALPLLVVSDAGDGAPAFSPTASQTVFAGKNEAFLFQPRVTVFTVTPAAARAMNAAPPTHVM